MRVTYDPQADALHIRFKAAPVAESDEDTSGLIFDYDADCNVVGFEMLSARRQVDNPFSLSYEVLPSVEQMPHAGR